MNRKQRKAKRIKARQHTERKRSGLLSGETKITGAGMIYGGVVKEVKITADPPNIAITAIAPTHDGLMALKRDELVLVASQHGMPVKSKTTKAQMTEFILAATA